MAHTFDIRFARAAGLSGLLDSPRNSFGWRGGGLLSIDARGVSVAVKRGLISLFARHRSQRIPAESITEVYREGDALRVEFATGENARSTLPFWAADRATAAQIVQLLPTSRTFEVEQEPDAPDKKPASRRTPWMLAAAVVLIVAAVFIIFTREQAPETLATPIMETVPEIYRAPPADPEVRPKAEDAFWTPMTPEQARRKALFDGVPVEFPESAAPSETNTPVEASAVVDLPVDTSPPVEAESEAEEFAPSAVPEIRVGNAERVVAIPQGTLASDAGRSLLARFEETVVAYRNEHFENRQKFDAGDLSRRGYVDHLISFQERWRVLGVALRDDREWQDPALGGLRATLVAVVNHQVRYFDGYASGLVGGNQRAIDQAFAERDLADDFLESARLYVR